MKIKTVGLTLKKQTVQKAAKKQSRKQLVKQILTLVEKLDGGPKTGFKVFSFGPELKKILPNPEIYGYCWGGRNGYVLKKCNQDIYAFTHPRYPKYED